jgi:hypothetical protein
MESQVQGESNMKQAGKKSEHAVKEQRKEDQGAGGRQSIPRSTTKQIM